VNELQDILSKSSASADVKQKALTVALQVATPIAFDASSKQAGGEFFALLLELLKLLLPILLGLLKPTT
jgi:hypothetical protein